LPGATTLNIFGLEVSFPRVAWGSRAYILASKRNGTLYVGVTSDLIQRVWQHKNDVVEGFTKRYGVHRLVWYEVCGTMESAVAREKAIKEWKRAWKIRVIQERNPEWRDLYDELL
jgi:putative endonuclease